jgi:hypothetical protein
MRKRRTGFFATVTRSLQEQEFKRSLVFDSISPNDILLREFLVCEGEPHEIVMKAGGSLVLKNHPKEDLVNQEALESLGSPDCACIRFMKMWRKRYRDYYTNDSLGVFTGLTPKIRAVMNFRGNFRPYVENEEQKDLSWRIIQRIYKAARDAVNKSIRKDAERVNPKVEAHMGNVALHTRYRSPYVYVNPRWMRIYNSIGGTVYSNRKVKQFFVLDIATDPKPKGKNRAYYKVAKRFATRDYSHDVQYDEAIVVVNPEENRIVRWTKLNPKELEGWTWVVKGWKYTPKKALTQE